MFEAVHAHEAGEGVQGVCKGGYSERVYIYFCTFNVYVERPSDGTSTEVGMGERELS